MRVECRRNKKGQLKPELLVSEQFSLIKHWPRPAQQDNYRHQLTLRLKQFLRSRLRMTLQPVRCSVHSTYSRNVGETKKVTDYTVIIDLG